MRPTWLRANRLWLPLVPVAVVAMLAGSAYNLQHWWWERGFHHPIAQASPGRFVSVVQHYTDTVGPTEARWRVRLDRVDTLSRVAVDGEQAHVPAGAAAYRLHLDFTAAPSMPLSDCNITLVDDQGRRYGDPGSQYPGLKCLPSGHTGPTWATLRGQKRGAVPRGEERPATWSTTPYVIAPRGLHITKAYLWVTYPDYVELPVG